MTAVSSDQGASARCAASVSNGGLYELFHDDAREAAAILELTLTSRNRNDPNPIPMAGIPYHALNGYLKRLVNAGRKVALAEQRAPAEGSGRKLMERELVRVVTPGILGIQTPLQQRAFTSLESGATGPWVSPFGQLHGTTMPD